jgi:GGDEF domain-containing protein
VGHPAETLAITISVGITEFPGDDDTGTLLIDLADKALYQAKRQGCNQAVCYHMITPSAKPEGQGVP